MSFGDDKMVERMRLAIDPAKSMEAKNLGLLYVAMSRVEKDSYWVLETRGIDQAPEPPPPKPPPQAARVAAGADLAAQVARRRSSRLPATPPRVPRGSA